MGITKIKSFFIRRSLEGGVMAAFFIWAFLLRHACLRQQLARIFDGYRIRNAAGLLQHALFVFLFVFFVVVVVFCFGRGVIQRAARISGIGRGIQLKDEIVGLQATQQRGREVRCGIERRSNRREGGDDAVMICWFLS